MHSTSEIPHTHRPTDPHCPRRNFLQYRCEFRAGCLNSQAQRHQFRYDIPHCLGQLVPGAPATTRFVLRRGMPENRERTGFQPGGRQQCVFSIAVRRFGSGSVCAYITDFRKVEKNDAAAAERGNPGDARRARHLRKRWKNPKRVINDGKSCRLPFVGILATQLETSSRPGHMPESPSRSSLCRGPGRVRRQSRSSLSGTS